MCIKLRLSIFMVLVVVLTGTTTRVLAANENGINWRIEVAKHIDKTYSETSAAINLFVALLSNQKYYNQIREELKAADKRQHCGLQFLPFRVAKSKEIDFESTIVLLSDLVSPSETNIITRYGSSNGTSDARELLVLPFSPNTANVFWVADEVVDPSNVALLSATFEKMEPLWSALLAKVEDPIQRKGTRRMGLPFVKSEGCDEGRDQYTYSTYVPFLGERTAPQIELVPKVAAQMSLAQLELLERVGAFITGPLMRAGVAYPTSRPELIFLQIEEIKRLKLESFDDLDLGSPAASDGSNEFEDLELDDLDLGSPAASDGSNEVEDLELDDSDLNI